MHHMERKNLVKSIVEVLTDRNNFTNDVPWRIVPDGQIDFKSKKTDILYGEGYVACLKHTSVRANDGEVIAPVTMIDTREFEHDFARRMIRTFFVKNGSVISVIGDRDSINLTPGSSPHIGFWEHNEKLRLEGLGEDCDHFYFAGDNVEKGGMDQALRHYAKHITFKAEYIARSLAARYR